MFPLLLGIGLFVSAVIIVTTVKSFFKITYDTHPYIYAGLFTSLLVLVHFSYPIFSEKFAVGFLILGLIYCSVMSLFRVSGHINKMFGTNTLPLVHSGIAKPTIQGDVVKVIEVLLQGMSAWLTVIGLSLLFGEMYLVILAFSLVVLFLHVPGLFMFRKVYGMYFLLTSTALAFTVPLFLQLGEIGFLYVFGIHLYVYLLMYLFMGKLGKNVSDC